MSRRIIVGISGASGAPLAARLLGTLHAMSEKEKIELHLVMTRCARLTIAEECKGFFGSENPVDGMRALADVVYENDNIGAAIASGSFTTEGMIVCPCSMKTLAGVAHGYSDNLLLRAADVCIKEQRRLVLMPRETPMSAIHLDNLAYLAKLPGVMIVPPVLTYYHAPKTIEDMETQLVGRLLRVFGMDSEAYREWG